MYTTSNLIIGTLNVLKKNDATANINLDNRTSKDNNFTPDRTHANIHTQVFESTFIPNNKHQIVKNIFTPDRTNTNLAKHKIENLLIPNNNRINKETILESINVPKKNDVHRAFIDTIVSKRIFADTTQANSNYLIDLTKEVIYLFK